MENSYLSMELVGSKRKGNNFFVFQKRNKRNTEFYLLVPHCHIKEICKP